MRAPGRSIAVALAPAGTVAGHALGYLVAGEDVALQGSHGHLGPAAWAAAAAVAATLALVAVVRPSRGPSRPRIACLVSVQVMLFGLLEVGEHLSSGHGLLSVVTNPTFRWGVVAQLGSAAVLVAAVGLARTSGERVRAFLLGRPATSRHATRRQWSNLRTEVRRPASSGSAVSERGPPRLLAPA